MANPLMSVVPHTTVRSQDELRQWCWERNQTALRSNWPSWLYVFHDKDTGTNAVKSRTGADGRECQKVLRGWYPDFMNWPSDRLASEFRILRFMVRMGMTEDAYRGVKLAA